MGRPVIVDSELLRYLAREHLALLNEVREAAQASLITCAFCGNCENIPAECTKKCGECTMSFECPCHGCGASAERFEWQGVTETNAPEDAEVENVITAIATDVSE